MYLFEVYDTSSITNRTECIFRTTNRNSANAFILQYVAESFTSITGELELSGYDYFNDKFVDYKDIVDKSMHQPLFDEVQTRVFKSNDNGDFEEIEDEIEDISNDNVDDQLDDDDMHNGDNSNDWDEDDYDDYYEDDDDDYF